MSQLVSSSISQRDTWTVQFISVFSLPSVTHNSQSLLSCPILETSATASCGTTGSPLIRPYFLGGGGIGGVPLGSHEFSIHALSWAGGGVCMVHLIVKVVPLLDILAQGNLNPR